MEIIEGENTAYKKLLRLGISLLLIDSRNFPSKEISLLNKSLGIVKSNGDKNQKFWLFNEIEIDEFIDGRHMIIFSLSPANSLDIQQIVDTLFLEFGIDSSEREMFLPYEKLIFEKEAFSIYPTRQWVDFEDYDVELEGYLEGSIIKLTLIDKII